MAKNQNLVKQALYYWDEDLKEWRPVNFNFDVNGGLVVSSYESNPVHISITELPLPSGAATEVTLVDIKGRYATRIDEVDSSTTYVGEAAVGTATSAASWRIKKLAVSGTVTSITWADGNTTADNIWDNRTSLSYS